MPRFLTSPGFAYECMLKVTGVELELVSDPLLYQFGERLARGGLSMIGKRHAKANLPWLPDYDKNTENQWIVYVDACNLYGHSLSQKLPVKDFRWCTQEEIKHFDVMTVDENSSEGYIIECDLSYPVELHDDHNDLPLAPELMTVNDDMLSPYSLALKKKINYRARPSKKLIASLFDRKNYLVHYLELQKYLSLGMQLTKIHRMVKFEQKAYMKCYIDLNTKLRREASTLFEKCFYKLMNNSVFGKSLENVRKYKNIQLVNSTKALKKISRKPNITHVKIINEGVVIFSLKQPNIVLSRPVFTGSTVLSLSKLVVYDFHYNVIMKKYGKEKAKLLMTDTDSLKYIISTDDIMKDMLEFQDYLDTSNFPKDHFLYSEKNKGVVGKFKFEEGHKLITHFTGLRSKLYCYICEGIECKKAKGVSRNYVKSHVTYDMYEQALFNETEFMCEQSTIKSDHHQLYTVKLSKKSLSPFEDKKYVCNNKVDTLSHGHYKIAQMGEKI